MSLCQHAAEQGAEGPEGGSQNHAPNGLFLWKLTHVHVYVM